jgi:hypothetical protein
VAFGDSRDKEGHNLIAGDSRAPDVGRPRRRDHRRRRDLRRVARAYPDAEAQQLILKGKRAQVDVFRIPP